MTVLRLATRPSLRYRALCAALVLLCAAGPTVAELLDGAGFAALTDNQTITWQGDGFVGQERYLPGGQVMWQVEDNPECEFGRWISVMIAEQPAICFLYENSLTPVCWHIEQAETGMIARSVETPENRFVEIGRSEAPLNCHGPMVGV